MAMNCPECGVPVETGAQFCPQCFARIEPPGLWRRFLALFQSTGPRRIVNLKTTVTVKTTDEAGREHEYHSLSELPPELRAEMEKLETEALKGNMDSTGTDISRTESEIYMLKDAAGNERIYHPLEELPPEIRAAVENAQKKIS
jgi:uncharacterized Zn finger protein (UPF0148 family)